MDDVKFLWEDKIVEVKGVKMTFEFITSIFNIIINPENFRLEQEVKILRHYGNKDCTVMADQAIKDGVVI